MASHAVTDALLLPRSEGAVAGAVDFRGRPASRASTGRWSAAMFVLGVEIAERFAYHGVSANLISYLTGPLGESTAGAAAAINLWSGVATMLPLLVACVADAWLGRYRTIVLASLLFVVSMGMLTLSSALPAFHSDGGCSYTSKSLACSPSTTQVAIFYVSLYLVALAEAGHKPCAQAFGADQFDQNDAKESVSRSSFFNWWYFGMCSGTAMTTMVSSYIQDNVGWGLGFGIPCLVMVFALVMFLLGTRNYRYYVSTQSSPFARLARAFVALIKGSKDNALAVVDDDNDGDHREELRSVLRLFPIWATCIIYAVIFSQSSTFFTKQAATLDRRIGESFKVPPAALQTFISVTIIAFIPVYDRAFVPVARRFTRMSSGITMLQRIGTGLALALAAMVVAALVEARRLGVARDAGMVDNPKAALPMSLWWMVPQYVLFGLSDVFAMIGLQEFFYDQVPDALRSLGLAFFLSIFGVGHFFSSFIISAIDGATKKSGASWFANNLNRAHLDYFYWLLAGLCAVELVAFVVVSRVYVYKKRLLSHLLDSDMADTVAGAVDYRGRPASRAATGGWKSSVFVMAMEIAERFAYKGVAANLITYLTGPLGQPMASAAASIDAWKGVSQMLPLPLACVADAWLGRYRAIVLASVIFVLSMGTLSMSPAFPVSRAGHVGVFYAALYMVALGEGAHKPCAQAFAADQFDEKDGEECVARSSFFNWWYFGMCAGTAVTTMVSSYVQDNVGWGLGFGIPCIVIVVSLAAFLLGTRSYRFYTTRAANPVARVGKAFLTLIKSWRSSRRTNPASGGKGDGDGDAGDLVEEVKSVFRLLPIWASCIIYAIIFSQTSTFFTKQAATLDRRIGRSFNVPPAALQTFISVSIVVFIPVYDRLFVPFARRYTGRPSGITMLQRVGAGLALSLVSVTLSALVETKRLRVAADAGMVDTTKARLPMSLWWMVPQYVLIGVADVFAMIGLQEFFYDQVPDAVRSLGLALFLSIFGVGHLLSSLLISVIDGATARRAGGSWFANNLNRAHLDYFYWLLAGLCAVELVAFFLFSRVYTYKKKGSDADGNAVGFFERTGFNGVQGKLIMYLTGPMGMSTAAAAAGVNAWGWTVFVLPLVGALAADSWIRRYQAVVVAGVLCLLVAHRGQVVPATDGGAIWAASVHKSLLSLGHFCLLRRLGMATSATCTLSSFTAWQRALFALIELVRRHDRPTGSRRNEEKEGEEKKRRKTEGLKNVTAMACGTQPISRIVMSLGMLRVLSMLPPFHPDHPAACQDTAAVCSSPAAAPASRVAFFYVALYMLALGQSFHRPCAQAIGADQFPKDSARGLASRSSFFNWLHISMSLGYAIADNIGWPVGFAACWAMMLVSLFVFLLGTGTYRPEQLRRAGTFGETAKVWTAAVFRRSRKDAMDTASLLIPSTPRGHGAGKGVVAKLLPIWMTSLVYAVVLAQMVTLFTKQGSTMDRRIVVGTGGATLVVPPVALPEHRLPCHHGVHPGLRPPIVPLARRVTKHPWGSEICFYAPKKSCTKIKAHHEQCALLPEAEPSTGSKAGGRGGWSAAFFLIASVFAERVGFNGVQGNLIMYLTGPMGMSTAAAAAAVNAWGGTAFMLPLLGALAADLCIGRHRAVVASGVLYLLVDEPPDLF
uniref:Uncharacterized protein n=1 Tax=Oryza punctata TaxID=4537 RepID=A0A0E0JRL5_ORYPU